MKENEKKNFCLNDAWQPMFVERRKKKKKIKWPMFQIPEWQRNFFLNSLASNNNSTWQQFFFCPAVAAVQEF